MQTRPLLTWLVAPLCVLSVSLFAACSSRNSPARLPLPTEAPPEQILATLTATHLRLLPALAPGASDPHYLLLTRDATTPAASLGTVQTLDEQAAPDQLARAGQHAVLAGHVLFVPPQPAAEGVKPLVIERQRLDGTPAAAFQLTLRQPCPQRPTHPPLIQADAQHAYVLTRCAGGGLRLLTLDAEGTVQTERVLSEAEDADLFLHAKDGFYVAAGRQILFWADGQALPTIGTVPPPRGTAETRELLRWGDHLLVIDGVAGRLIALHKHQMNWVFERRLDGNERIERLRAAASRDRLTIVVAERTASGLELLGMGLSLALDSRRETEISPTRILLGPAQAPSGGSDHELVPTTAIGGDGVLLVYSRPGPTGTLLMRRRLTL